MVPYGNAICKNHEWKNLRRCARALPCGRCGRQGLRQADRRHRQLVRRIRARARASEQGGPPRLRSGQAGGRHPARIQYDGRRRRHRHGPHRHAVFAAEPRDHRRHRGIPGQRALRRRAHLHLELRQDHAGHAHGRAAPQHPHRVRLRRPDGGRHNGAARTAPSRRTPT